MSRRTLYYHLHKIGFIQGRNMPLNDFNKQISRSEFDLLNNKNKKKYNRYAAAHNLKVYAKAK